MPKADGAVIINTKFNTSGFGKGATNLKSQFNGLATAGKKLGGILAATFSVKKIVDFSKDAIQLGSDLQEVQNVVDVTFTSMNEQVNEFAKNAAKSAGLSETMAKRYAGTFGAMSKSFGFSESESYAMSTALTQLTGDVASFYNLSQDAAYTKLKSVFTGETESLKDLGVVMTQTALDDFALRKGLGKTTQQMSEQEKVALRYQFVMEQLTGASGDFVRTQDSWANQTRVLTLQFEQFKATVGQGLINVLTPVIKVINTLLGKLQVLAETFRSFTAQLFGNASSSGGGVAETLGAAAESSEDLAEGVTAAGKAAKKSVAGFDELNVLSSPDGKSNSAGAGVGAGGIPNISGGTVTVESDVQDNITPKIQALIEKIKGFGEEIITAFMPSISAWSEAFSGLGPSIESAGSRIGTAWTTLKDTALAPFGEYITTDFIPSIVNDFSTTLAPIFADVMPAVVGLWTTDFENSCLLIQKYCGILQMAFEGVKKVFSDMCDSISSNWETYGGDLLQGFTDFKDGLWETWWYIYENIIDPVITACSETLSWLWDEHLKPLWDDIVEFVLSVGENILALWNGFLKPVIDWLITILGPIVTNIINGIVDAVAIGIAVISDIIGGILTFLDGLIQFIVGVFTLDWERAWGGVKKMFEGAWNSFIGIVKGVVNSIIWVINQLVAAIYSGIAGIVNGLGSIVDTVGDMLGQNWGFSIPTRAPRIPYLAHGAVIPPNAPFMAVLGDQRHGTNIEAPLSTIQEAVANVMNENVSAMMAGFEALLEENRQLRQVVEAIEVGDATIGEAVNRYNRKMAVLRGG